MDLYYVTESSIEGNFCSNNTGWGIHLFQSSWNAIASNTFDSNNRAKGRGVSTISHSLTHTDKLLLISS
jgi:parallel beta-helix repeat protein